MINVMIKATPRSDGKIEHRTSNIEHPILAGPTGRWVLGVGGWLLDVFQLWR
jgi:hypothetical protein